MTRILFLMISSALVLSASVAMGAEHTQLAGIDPLNQTDTGIAGQQGSSQTPNNQTPPTQTPQTPTTPTVQNPQTQSPQPPTTQTQQPRNVRLTSTPMPRSGPPKQQSFGPIALTNPGLSSLSTAGTGNLREQIVTAAEMCGWFPVEVRIDCVADRLREIARSIPSTGEYAPVREAFEEAAAELREISGRYAAAGAPAQLYQAPSPVDGAPVRTSRLTSVEPALQTQALQEALQVVEELETTLLRSAENSRKRQVHFQEIAASVGSTKVLLRSA